MDSRWSGLPLDLQERVLARIPIACIYRLRSVCKIWNTILSSFNVLRCCVERSLERPTLLVLNPALFAITCFDPLTSKLHAIGIRSLPKILEVEATAAGLWCCKAYVEEVTRCIVCNPATKAWVLLPCTGLKVVKTVMVVDRSIQAFKVVKTLQLPAETDTSQLTVEVYDSKSKRWTMVGTMPPRTIFGSIVVCQGHMYSLGVGLPLHAVAFHLTLGTWNRISLPSDRGVLQLIERDDQLFFLGYDEDMFTIFVWRLEQVTMEWMVYTTMPILPGDFLSNSYMNLVAVISGNFLYLASPSIRDKLVAYDFVQGLWGYLPMSPLLHIWTKSYVWGYDPCLDGPW